MVNIACHFKQSSKTSFRGTLSWGWGGWKSGVRVVPTATTRVLRRRSPGTCETEGQVFKFIWRLRWKIKCCLCVIITIRFFSITICNLLIDFLSYISVFLHRLFSFLQLCIHLLHGGTFHHLSLLLAMLSTLCDIQTPATLRAAGVPFHATAYAKGLINSHTHTFPVVNWYTAAGISGGISSTIWGVEVRSFVMVDQLSLLLCKPHRHFSEQLLNDVQWTQSHWEVKHLHLWKLKYCFCIVSGLGVGFF
jgi:hypothetical protein